MIPKAPKPSRLYWLLAILLMLVSCSSTTRYRVLSFLFDGVKPPQELVEAQEVAAATQPTATTRPAFLEDGVAAMGSRHVPFGIEDCRLCHDTETGFSLQNVTAEACYNCHGETARAEGWDHGPISLNSCTPCHNAHESPYPHLLTQPMPDLCLFCHTPIKDGGEYYHPNLGIRLEVDMGNCSACHNPHKV